MSSERADGIGSEPARSAAAVCREARASDLPAALALIAGAGLPVEGVAEWFDRFVVAEDERGLAGVAGLEVYGRHALLRSVAVRQETRGGGVGRTLVQAALRHAHDNGATDVYLLTETAEDYFPRFGFRRIMRDGVPAAVRESVEFRELCPASSAVLVLRLDDAEVSPG